MEFPSVHPIDSVSSPEPRFTTLVTTDDEGTVTRRLVVRVPLRDIYTIDD